MTGPSRRDGASRTGTPSFDPLRTREHDGSRLHDAYVAKMEVLSFPRFDCGTGERCPSAQREQVRANESYPDRTRHDQEQGL